MQLCTFVPLSLNFDNFVTFGLPYVETLDLVSITIIKYKYYNNANIRVVFSDDKLDIQFSLGRILHHDVGI